MAKIQGEAAGAFSNDQIDMSWLLNSCPRLNGFFDEIMRMTNSSSSVCTVVSDVAISDCIIRAGAKILIPYRQLHFNKDVFGTDGLDLDPERFLETKAVARSPSHRPLGGGSTYYLGRFIAIQEVAAFIGIVQNELKVELADRNGVPRLEGMKPCPRVMGPVAAGNLTVKVERR